MKQPYYDSFFLVWSTSVKKSRTRLRASERSFPGSFSCSGPAHPRLYRLVFTTLIVSSLDGDIVRALDWQSEGCGIAPPQSQWKELFQEFFAASNSAMKRANFSKAFYFFWQTNFFVYFIINIFAKVTPILKKYVGSFWYMKNRGQPQNISRAVNFKLRLGKINLSVTPTESNSWKLKVKTWNCDEFYLCSRESN